MTGRLKEIESDLKAIVRAFPLSAEGYENESRIWVKRSEVYELYRFLQMRWANLARDAEKIAHYECYPEWIDLGEEYFESCTEGSSAYLKLWWNTASSRSDNALKTHLIAQMDICQEGDVIRVLFDGDILLCRYADGWLDLKEMIGSHELSGVEAELWECPEALEKIKADTETCPSLEFAAILYRQLAQFQMLTCKCEGVPSTAKDYLRIAEWLEELKNCREMIQRTTSGFNS